MEVDRTPHVKGACVECGTEINMVLGEPYDQIRWYLAEKVRCPHCEALLTAAILDSANRFWGRKRVWHD